MSLCNRKQALKRASVWTRVGYADSPPESSLIKMKAYKATYGCNEFGLHILPQNHFASRNRNTKIAMRISQKVNTHWERTKRATESRMLAQPQQSKAAKCKALAEDINCKQRKFIKAGQEVKHVSARSLVYCNLHEMWPQARKKIVSTNCFLEPKN